MRRIWFHAALCGMVFSWGSRGFAQAGTQPPKVLVLHEGTGGKQDAAQAAAMSLQALLGHFSVDVKTQSVADYPSGMMQRFDCVFFIGSQPRYKLPAAFLQDVPRFNGTLCWAGSGLEQLAPTQTARWNLRNPHPDKSLRVQSVFYHGQRLRVDEESSLNVVSLINPARSTVLAVGRNGTASVPYLLRTGNFWFVADNPLANAGEGDRSVAFADTLHDILGQPHPSQRQAILRIEDVNLSDDVEDLRRVADLLAQRRVPFVISLVPVYVNPQEGTHLALSSRRDFVSAIQYMILRGGTVVMHGATHQYHGISADDYEFWDATRQTPIREDSAQYVRDRLSQGLRACFDSGIYPVAWETPHYAASMRDYRTIAQHFSTVVEQRIYLDTAKFAQAFPFRIQRDCFGQQVIPENAGYVPLALLPGSDEQEDLAQERRSVRQIVANAQAYSGVRDAFVGVFFHPFLETELLASLVDGLKEVGYTFVDLKRFNNRVMLDDKCVLTGSGTMRVTLKHAYLREIWLDAQGNVRLETYSSKPLNGTITKAVQCPAGWVYVAEGASSRPPSAWKTWTHRLVNNVRQMRTSAPPEPDEAHVGIVWNLRAQDGLAKDQQSFERAYQSAGFQPQRIIPNPKSQIPNPKSGVNYLVVPQAAAQELTAEQQSVIVQFVRNGGNLVTDGYSPLSQQLGVTPTDSRDEVRGASDQITQLPLAWRQPARVRFPELPRNAIVLYRDSEQDLPLGFLCQRGKGRLVFLATLFDPVTGWGYGRFPTLVTNALRGSNLIPTLRSPKVEVFFDPAYRENLSVEQLAVQWRHAGVRAVHVAMWHDYPGYAHKGGERHGVRSLRYDYARLIRNCHANGILVYAWFELPYLTVKFWKEHPEWREKNRRGKDVMAGWRYPLAMEVPDCEKAVLSEMKRALAKQDWDGVNVAELDFESPGPESPDQFQPMHPAFRQQFQKQHGFDPAEVLDKRSPHFFRRDARAWQLLEEARVEMVTRWHRDVLEALENVRRGRDNDLEVIVTAQDSLHAPHLRKQIGVDMRRIIALMEHYDFTLNVEDPEEMWNQSPDRYERIGADFRRLVPDAQRLMLDLNIVDIADRKGGQHGFATARPTGAELTALVHAALKHVPRVVIYSEASVLPQDFPLLASAYASVNGERRERTLCRSDDDDDDANSIPIPHIVSITGELLQQQQRGQELTLRYRSRARCLLSLADAPERVWVDGEPYRETFLTGHDCHTVALPDGEHTVRILQAARALYQVQVFSSLLSTALVGGGKVACLMLFAMFCVSRVYFRRRNR